MEKHTLILTIPWVTKYLAMLDYVALRLPYFEDIFELLFRINMACSPNMDSIHLTNANSVIVKLCLGWLFDMPHFPEGFYFNWCAKNCTNPIGDNDHTTSGIDRLDIIDQNMFHLCCPYIEDIKCLLLSNVSQSVTVKHITPLTTNQSVTGPSKCLQVVYWGGGLEIK
jgi:Codanin-1 C-terminus